MSYLALYRKYRPQTFNDCIDQDVAITILKNSLAKKRTSHAYLFSGPRGTGKTSIAKIFAKAVNCLDYEKYNDVCTKCKNCELCSDNSIDIIEIDAASNNGVDQIRELKNNVSVVPSELNFKVYIIDEVHMLTNSAFNALLKTLEEPPEHVIFILATTEFYSVPETIVSRCQCISFDRISNNGLIKRLKYISEIEKINIDEETLNEIALFSNGGLRDAVNMLDKISSYTNDLITVDVFRKVNGMISENDIRECFDYLLNSKIKEIIEKIDYIENNGYSFSNFIERMAIYGKNKLIEIITVNNDAENINKIISLIECLENIMYKLKITQKSSLVVQVELLNYIKNNNICNENKSRSDKNDGESEKDNQNNIKINQNAKKIRINNALTTANMNVKKLIVEMWSTFENDFMDDEYGKISQLLCDFKVEVASEQYLILSTELNGMIDNLYEKLYVAEKYLSGKLNKNIKIVAVLNKEFENIKKEYVLNRNNGVKYNMMRDEENLIIQNQSNLINKAIDIFGKDFVEIE